MPEHFAWTDHNVARLRQLFDDGLTSGQIAREMGVATRNAVIGKLGRLGLHRAERVPRHRRPHRTPVRKPPQMPTDQIPPPQPDPPHHAPPPQAQPAQPCTLLELTNESCRYPHGDVGMAGFYFCGALEADLNGGRPYCRSCAAIAYQPRRAGA